ncbi:MAG: uroporphyrinogen-III C-methyltransferase [Azoarcus sp.]|jgi:uroporphyrin-3 C-methyltransferase|nr:uroporphyrinogen-III C-methyltransferase [Azoarcus sp.]
MNSPASQSPDANSGSALPETAPETSVPKAAPAPASYPAEKHPPAPPPPRHDAPAAAPAPRSGAAGWALLLALLSLILAAYTLWQSREWHTVDAALHKEFGGKLADTEAAATETQDLAQQLATLKYRLGAIDTKIDRSEGQTVALENLYQQFSRSQEERIIAEIRQAVTIASQQLQYAGNVETALIALRGAQMRLEQNDHGQFAPLRRSLAADIEKLDQQGHLDIPDTALRLEQMLAKVDTLPLAYMSETSTASPPSRAVDPGDSDIAGFAMALLGDIWDELRSLVKIERTDAETDPVLLSPAQNAFLRENLKIRLLTARLALLARDGHTYAADLTQARNWIERFFDMHDPDVKKAVDGLRTLEAMPVGVKRYELIESLAALRSLEAPRSRAGSRLPSAPPARNSDAPDADAADPSDEETPPPAQP